MYLCHGCLFASKFITICLYLYILERFYLLLWPEESSYSVVPETKIVNPKEPSTGQTVQVKEGSKSFSGTVVAVGTKPDIERRLSEIEGNKTQGK